MPLGFEINEGQTDSRVHFLARGSGFSLFLTSSGATLRLHARGPQRVGAPADPVLALRLAGPNPASSVEGLERLPGKSHYFLGHNRASWRTNISSYARVKYRDVYPGVDLVFYGNQGRLEYDFLVAPGGDSSRIQFELDGADAQRIDEQGDLIIRVAGVEFRQWRPVVYQDWGNSRHFLAGRYVLRGERQVGFQIEDGYRTDEMLVIDPVLVYASYLGGSGLDIGHAVAVDASDNVYLTGETASTNFPTVNPEQPQNAGGFDAFVTKLDPTGTTILFSSYLGGSGNENNFHSGVESSGVAVDSAGNVYLAGRTDSQDFPTVNALFDSYRGGDEDGFVAKVSTDGATLLYSSYFGGENNDSVNGLTVDSAGNMYLTGGTKSESDFPISPGAFQRTLAAQLDAYVAKIDPTQTGSASLLYSTYLGGLGIDRGTAVAVDSAGNAYVTGRTDSSDFPTVSPFQPVYGGAVDAFVAVVNPNATALVYSTFLGGSDLDAGNSIIVDSAGNAYVAGETASSDFPGTMNGYQPAIAGNSDAFVAQLDPTGAILVYATYLGGTGLDRGTGIAIDAIGMLSVTGETSSGNFPTVNPFQGTPGGGKDAFVARLDPSQQGAASLLYSSFLGGSTDDLAFGIAVNSTGDAWIVGQTGGNFPTVNPQQPDYGGGFWDAFIARVSTAAATPDYGVSAAPASLSIVPGDTANYTVTVSPVAGFTGTVGLSAGGLPANAMATFDPPSVVITDATPQTSMMTLTTMPSTPLGTFPLSITASRDPLQHTTSVTLVMTDQTNTADLSLAKNGSSNPVELGMNLSYVIKAVNQGPAVATGVQVTDPLPNVAFVSATSTQGTCSGTSTVVCNIGPLAVGSMATVTIVVTPQAIWSVRNTATVTADQPDPNPDNNSATVATTLKHGVPVRARACWIRTSRSTPSFRG